MTTYTVHGTCVGFLSGNIDCRQAVMIVGKRGIGYADAVHVGLRARHAAPCYRQQNALDSCLALSMAVTLHVTSFAT